MIVLHHIESVFSVGRNLESFNFFTPSRTALNILDDLQSPLTNSTCIESVTAFGPVHPLIYLSETSLCPVLQDLENNIGTPWNGWNPLPCFSNLRFVYTLHTLITSKGPVQWTKDNSGGAMGDAGMLDTLNTWQGYHLQCPSWSLAMQYGHTVILGHTVIPFFYVTSNTRAFCMEASTTCHPDNETIEQVCSW